MAKSAVHSKASVALVAALTGALALSGCARWNWRGSGFGNNEGAWARKLRPPADEKQLSGLDARAQEIERNLGVR